MLVQMSSQNECESDGLHIVRIAFSHCFLIAHSLESRLLRARVWRTIMAKQVPQIVADCPIEIQSHCMPHDAVCGIWGEPFSVSDKNNGRLTVAASECWHLPTFAEHATVQAYNTSAVRQRTEPQWHMDDAGRMWVYPPCNGIKLRPRVFIAPDYSTTTNRSPLVLVVEHRDEVFARIATDVAQSGYYVLRAETAGEAMRLSGKFRPTLVIANSDLSDQSGWLMTAKLRFIDPEARIWLYLSETTPDDEGMARFLQLDELLAYGGNLLKLSEMVVDLLFRPESEARAALDPNELLIA